MATIDVFDIQGQAVGKVDLDDTLFGVEPSEGAIYQAVKSYLTNRRQGTAATKTRAEVFLTKRKMYRQKGTGNARAGHRSSGVRRGGGHIFAKKQRSYYYRLPAKAVRSATRMAIASKIQDGEFVVVDGVSLDAPKTQQVAELLSNLELSGKSALITTKEHDINIYKSARNIERVNVSPVSDLNALSVLQVDKLVMTTEAVESLNASIGEAS